MNNPVKLRPHHLLCTQGYSGKGYNADFVENMTAITTFLRTNNNAVVEIVFGADDICAKCPRLMHGDLCDNEIKVRTMDSKVSRHFEIKETYYNYKKITAKINSQMIKEKMDDICVNCEWYPISNCKKLILKR